MGLFSFARRGAIRASAQGAASPCAELGRGLVALRLRGEAVPADCVQVVFSESGQSRRVPAASARDGEAAYCFHPGPYSVDLAPFPAAPEIGLRTRFVIDAADPRVAQQRFDLYLFSEVPASLPLAALESAIDAAVRDALAQGMLDLPPCTSLDEWNAFRAGLNQLLYTRFGVTVDDCVPADLGGMTDYAARLRARAAGAVPRGATPAAGVAATADSLSILPAAAGGAAVSFPASRPVSTREAAAGQPPATLADMAGRQPVPVASAFQAAPPPASGHASISAPAALFTTLPATATMSATTTTTTTTTTATATTTTAPAPAADGPELPLPGGPAAVARPPVAAPAGCAGAASAVADDAHALRRLFLELPALSGGLRLVALPPGPALFLAHRGLLQRIALSALDVNTMPALAWTAPDTPAPAAQQRRRAWHSVQAVRELDQAWALLARMQLAAKAPHPGAACSPVQEASLAALLDEGDRLAANLDHHLAGRRVAIADPDGAGPWEGGPEPANNPGPSPQQGPGQKPETYPARREPSL